MVWHSKVKGLTEKVIELYPKMSSREIAEITGFAKTTIIRCAAKNHLRQKYCYFYETVDKTVLFYDSQTRRVKNENYYTEKYGISFIQADE